MARHVSTRHVERVELVEQSTAWHTYLDALDTSNVSDVTWWAKWNLGYTMWSSVSWMLHWWSHWATSWMNQFHLFDHSVITHIFSCLCPFSFLKFYEFWTHIPIDWKTYLHRQKQEMWIPLFNCAFENSFTYLQILFTNLNLIFARSSHFQ